MKKRVVTVPAVFAEGRGGMRLFRKIFDLLPLMLVSAVSLYFIFSSFFNAFKTRTDFFTNITGLPRTWTLQNITKAWQVGKFGRYFGNSIIVSGFSTILVVFICSLTAYGIARFKFRINYWLYGIFSFGLMFPVMSLTVPIFLILRNVGLANTIPGIILVYTSVMIAFGVFVLTGFFKTLPTEVHEAARIDGAGEFRIFASIMMPMAKPVLATLGMITSINVWNDFFLSLVFLHDNRIKTLPLAMQGFFARYGNDLPLTFAALFITTVPIVVAYVAGSRQIIRGLTEGSIK